MANIVKRLTVFALTVAIVLAGMPVSAKAAEAADYAFTVDARSTTVLQIAYLNATFDGIVWKSSNPGVAAVTANAKNVLLSDLVAKKAGTATITANITAGGKKASVRFDVTVVGASKEKEPAVGISRKTATLVPGSSLPVSVKGIAKDAIVEWTSGDYFVASIEAKADKLAVLHSYGTGTAKLTAKVVSGGTIKKYSMVVTVKNANGGCFLETPTMPDPSDFVFHSKSVTITYRDMYTVGAGTEPGGYLCIDFYVANNGDKGWSMYVDGLVKINAAGLDAGVVSYGLPSGAKLTFSVMLSYEEAKAIGISKLTDIKTVKLAFILSETEGGADRISTGDLVLYPK